MLAWLTPRVPASSTVVAVIRIPDSPEARAQLRGFLLECIQASNYEASFDGMTPEAAANEWLQAFEDFAARIDCDDV